MDVNFPHHFLKGLNAKGLCDGTAGKDGEASLESLRKLIGLHNQCSIEESDDFGNKKDVVDQDQPEEDLHMILFREVLLREAKGNQENTKNSSMDQLKTL